MIHQNIYIPNASAKQIYDQLLDSGRHAELIGDKVSINAVEGESFSTFGGYAEGRNITLKKNLQIIQSWRASDWPKDHYSEICFNLQDKDDGVSIEFSQSNLPSGAEEEFESGWEDFYWKPLKDYYK